MEGEAQGRLKGAGYESREATLSRVCMQHCHLVPSGGRWSGKAVLLHAGSGFVHPKPLVLVS